MLVRLNDGPLPDAMALPGYRLHQLKGDRKGSWSVWVSGNYRLIFDIEGEDATNVDFEDYKEAHFMEMFDPPHPGEIIREDCLKPLGLTVTEAAKGLGVSRQSLSELLNGRNGISAEMALRLERAGWSTAESWLRNQLTYDLWQAKQHAGCLKVTKFGAPDLA